MSVAIENLDNTKSETTAVPSNFDNESNNTAKLFSIVLHHDHEESGDWNEQASAWYSQDVGENVENLEPVNSTEWKYKNLYSMSVPKNHSTYWSPSRHATMITGNDKK